jgi:hypothetical protein
LVLKTVSWERASGALDASFCEDSTPAALGNTLFSSWLQLQQDSNGDGRPASGPATVAAFKKDWGLGPDVQVGWYDNTDGLSTGGDEVNVFDSSDNWVSGVSFGAIAKGQTFDNFAASARGSRIRRRSQR